MWCVCLDLCPVPTLTEWTVTKRTEQGLDVILLWVAKVQGDPQRPGAAIFNCYRPRSVI